MRRASRSAAGSRSRSSPARQHPYLSTPVSVKWRPANTAAAGTAVHDQVDVATKLAMLAKPLSRPSPLSATRKWWPLTRFEQKNPPKTPSLQGPCHQTWNNVNSSRSTSAGWPCGRASAVRVTTTRPTRPAFACPTWSTVERYRNGRELATDAALPGAACACDRTMIKLCHEHLT